MSANADEDIWGNRGREDLRERGRERESIKFVERRQLFDVRPAAGSARFGSFRAMEIKHLEFGLRGVSWDV